MAQQAEQMYPRWAKAQRYAAEGFTPVDCFAGQVKVRGRRIAQESFSIFLAEGCKKCCGTPIRSAQTDKHGHFVVEPLLEGEYFAQFHFKGVEHVARFAILAGYDRCGASDYVQVNFAEPNKAEVLESIWINDSGRHARRTSLNAIASRASRIWCSGRLTA